MRARAATCVIGAALVLAACGGDDETSGGGSSAAPSAVEATMEGFEFTPSTLEVAKGGTITWTDEDSSNHNVVFKSPGAPKGIANLREGQSGKVTFPDPGAYDFVCSYHPNMRGTVTVR